jgi:hypothetical protein
MLTSIDIHYVRVGILSSLLLCAVLFSYMSSPARHSHQLLRTLGGLPDSKSERCHYGSLPGHWVSSGPDGAKWQLLGSRCQLHNNVADYKHHHNCQPARYRRSAANICMAQRSRSSILLTASPPTTPTPFKRATLPPWLQLASAYFPGVHPKQQFKRPPDMVVVSSLLWDIARLYSQVELEAAFIFIF